MTEELDKTRRYLRPVRATLISDDPNGVHLAKYEWLPMFDEWATGPGLCGESMQQGPLPEDTAVTCASCLAYKPQYERYLAPDYRPEDDDLEALRRRLSEADRLWREREAENGALFDKLMAAENERDRLLREVAAARKFAAEMRDFCSPHGVATDYADRLIEAMDRAKTAALPSGAREVRIVVHAPTDENAGQWAETIRDLVLAEHGQEMRLDVTILPEAGR